MTMSKIGLVLEGGGMKCAYTAGILDAMMDNGVTFDYCIGVSAGSANGISFIVGQREECPADRALATDQGKGISVNGKFIFGIPHRLVGVIDHELIAIDGIGEIVGYGGQLHCAASAAVKGIGGRSVELPCACKCVRAAGAAFCQQYNANDDYRQCGDRTAKHHTALRLFFLPFSDSLYRSI